MTSTRMNEVYNYEMVSRDEGTDENNSIFHAVMFHWFTRMILDTEVDSFDGKSARSSTIISIVMPPTTGRRSTRRRKAGPRLTSV